MFHAAIQGNTAAVANSVFTPAQLRAGDFR